MRLSGPALRHLGRHAVRRLPTNADVADRAPIVLTTRDRQILDAIHMHGFLTTELIELVYFPPPPEGRKDKCSRVYQRLADLWRWGHVQRLELPVSRHLGGRRPYLYALGRRGVPIVQEHWPDKWQPVQARRCDRVAEMNVDHELAVAALWANLAAHLRTTRARSLIWVPEREIRARHLSVRDPDGRRRLPVLPDGAFAVQYRDGSAQHCLVEVDMGSLTLRRFRRKVRAFEAFLAEGLAAPVIGDDFEVAVVTRSDRRLEELRAAARDEVPEDRRCSYLFATLHVLEPARFADAAWLNLDDEEVDLLWKKAYRDEPEPAESPAGAAPAGAER